MSFKPMDIDQWRKACRRVLMMGPPNSRKTSSLLTWPRPLHILVYPGEKGSASIPVEEGIHPWVWESEGESPRKIWHMVETMTKEIISGKHGEIATFAGDGLHKVYQTIYNMHRLELEASGEARAAAKGKDFDPEDVGGRAYGFSHKTFLEYLTEVNQSKVPNVVFTCWSAKEKDDPMERRSASSIWPDLPGTVAQSVLGEFTVVLYCEVGPLQPNGLANAKWVIKPMRDIKGVGTKCPPAIAKSIPASVPQDWARLEPLLLGQSHTTTKEAGK